MKNMFLILSVVFFITGCSEEEIKQPDNSIYGSWKLVEKGWSSVKNGFEITIRTDNSFNSSQFSGCTTGDINLTSNQIDLIYNCNGFTAKSENPSGTFKYNYEFVDGKLELTPQNFTCFEGCKYRLIKMPDCGCESKTRKKSKNLIGKMFYKKEDQDSNYNYPNLFTIRETNINDPHWVHIMVICNEEFLEGNYEFLKDLPIGESIQVKFSGHLKEMCKRPFSRANDIFDRITLTSIERQ